MVGVVLQSDCPPKAWSIPFPHCYNLTGHVMLPMCPDTLLQIIPNPKSGLGRNLESPNRVVDLEVHWHTCKTCHTFPSWRAAAEVLGEKLTKEDSLGLALKCQIEEL